MNIVSIGTIDTKGGAAGVAWALRERLKKDGHTVTTFVRYKYSTEDDVIVIPRKRFQDWLVKLFANDLKFARTDYLVETPEFKAADIIHCHNLHSNFFNLKTLQKMSTLKPIVWTMHDMWAFTGYASDSVTLRNPNKKKFLLYLWDTTPNLLKAKEKIYQQCKLTVVAVSMWMKKQLENSILKNQTITKIYNGVDTETFRMFDKNIVKQELKLPLDKKIITCFNKGFDVSNKIIDAYKDRTDVFFIAIGTGEVETRNQNLLRISFIEDKNTLAKYLSASTLMLYPTHGDSFGLIAAETQACGTPVVTVSVDALPEVVSHKETGYVAQYENIEDIKMGIEYILNLDTASYTEMCIKAREKVVTNFSFEKTYQEYLALYKKVLETNKS